MDAPSDAPAESSRLSGLTAGAAVGIVGLLVGMSIAFATGTQTEQYASDADLMRQSEQVLTVSAVTRADLGVVLVLARSAAGGLEVTDLGVATAELESNVRSLGESLAVWSDQLDEPNDRAASSMEAIEDSVSLALAAITADDVAAAESIALDRVLPDLDQLNQLIALERNEAAGRLNALRSSAGTLARLASLGVALIIPGIAFFVFRSAMRRRQRNAELQLELKQERELVKTKDEFVANLSHELRTPLTGIFGFAMVLDDMLDQGPEHLEFGMLAETTGVILSEASELNRMVDDLLTAAKKEGGSLKMVLEELEVEPVVESAIDLFRRQGLSLTVDCEPGVVSMDRHHVAQLVRNLVSNATKHGGPTIAIEGRAGEGTYELRVMDDGDGVPEELVERLFSRFVHQGETPLTTGSVGLGLFIAGMLAEAMGGNLGYERVDGISVFTLTLPLVAAEESVEEAAA
ncbi:MAG: HAMP domain-containing histidine kinase [Acidimicrobiia bacterium]|nr:HAMP domain-containing histidine kinase [Acidimicrobiia bacterium]